MVIETRPGEDILDSGMKHICFGISAEGINDSGFAGYISKHFWPDLANVGQLQLGTSITNECNGILFHALVCHSKRDGWVNPTCVIRRCFDSIDTEESVASVAIGRSILGQLDGSRFAEIYEGMEDSKKTIILF